MAFISESGIIVGTRSGKIQVESKSFVGTALPVCKYSDRSKRGGIVIPVVFECLLPSECQVIVLEEAKDTIETVSCVVCTVHTHAVGYNTADI